MINNDSIILLCNYTIVVEDNSTNNCFMGYYYGRYKKMDTNKCSKLKKKIVLYDKIVKFFEYLNLIGVRYLYMNKLSLGMC